MPRPLAVLLLLITTFLWGMAFVAQKSAMDSMGPLTFAAARFVLGGLAILPLALWEYSRRAHDISRRDWGLVLLLAVAFFMGSWLQQWGLTMTTVTNGGFLTSLYVMFVPLIGLIVLRHWPHPIVWICMPMALIGVYYLNGGGLDTFNAGDALVVSSAFFWAVQVLMLGFVANRTGLPIFVSAMCFIFSGLVSTGGALAFEAPTWSGLAGGWVQILYAGLLSTAVAFTLQAVGQRHVPAANAAIILSAESLFAALGGFLILGERLPGLGYAGAAMIFAAIVLVESVPALRRREPLAQMP
ncbi:permease [Youhaiella tibetensis]|uniref:DMT family transporter n=1 Tax=Paradevosia tibetensis TaxID=1447062 RepID=A0A5B9DRZ8_9HYPH|nr:DMT family transporter [Youhaiella tibetensis]AKR56516.1 Permease of the drug/metabolite transporter (DMT) superfamily [Devosia sp. H5989]QEE21559.1 DMT family transporter [Youhaiella tibetensis]GGF13891.1 permease [Youhaiella tibetensis]